MTLNKIVKVEDILVCHMDDEGIWMYNLLVAALNNYLSDEGISMMNKVMAF